MKTDLLKSILDDEFLETLAKSADLYKIGSNSVLDPEEIRIGLKVVPRAVLSMLISELSPMPTNSHKDIKLPFGVDAVVRVNKNASDDYTGSVYSGNKLVYDFMNRSIPGLGLILLSTFELYDMEELSGHKSGQSVQIEEKVQKLIDERMALHSLVGRVVEDKLSQREALHKLMMAKLNDKMNDKMNDKSTDVNSIPDLPPSPISPTKPLEIQAKDVVKKEVAKKELPLKKFLDRKRKPVEHHVEMSKSETIYCNDCAQPIFGSCGLSACICYGEDKNRKIWVKKNEDGISVRFSKSWSTENIEMLLEALRSKNER
jgi:hypothetical protein